MVPPLIHEVTRDGHKIVILAGRENLIRDHKRNMGKLLREVAHFQTHNAVDLESKAAAAFMFLHLQRQEFSDEFLHAEIVPYLLVDDDAFVRALFSMLQGPMSTIYNNQGVTHQFDHVLTHTTRSRWQRFGALEFAADPLTAREKLLDDLKFNRLSQHRLMPRV